VGALSYAPNTVRGDVQELYETCSICVEIIKQVLPQKFFFFFCFELDTRFLICFLIKFETHLKKIKHVLKQ
jgi:hypothetical protein